MPLKLAPLPQNVGGPDLQPLVAQINDRLRRIANETVAAAGPAGKRGPAGSSGSLDAPGDDTEVVFNDAGSFAASPLFVFFKDSGNLMLKGKPGTGVIAPVFNSTA